MSADPVAPSSAPRVDAPPAAPPRLDVDVTVRALAEMSPPDAAQATASFGALTLDEKRDLFPAMVRGLSVPQLIGVAQGLGDPVAQQELALAIDSFGSPQQQVELALTLMRPGAPPAADVHDDEGLSARGIADLAAATVAVGGTVVLGAAAITASVPAGAVVGAGVALAAVNGWGAASSLYDAGRAALDGKGAGEIGAHLLFGAANVAGGATALQSLKAISTFGPGLRALVAGLEIGAGGVCVYRAEANPTASTGERLTQAFMLTLHVSGTAVSFMLPRVVATNGLRPLDALSQHQQLSNRPLPTLNLRDKTGYDVADVQRALQALAEGRKPPPVRTFSPKLESGRPTALFSNDEVKWIYRPVSRSTPDPTVERLQIAKMADGRSLMQQQGIEACTAACSGMLIVDNGGRLNVATVVTRNMDDADVPGDIVRAGLRPVEKSLQSIGELAASIRKDGSAVVSMQTEIGGHVAVVDAVDFAKGTVRLREPWHGWDVEVSIAAFEQRTFANRSRFIGDGSPEHPLGVKTIQVEGGRRFAP